MADSPNAGSIQASKDINQLTVLRLIQWAVNVVVRRIAWKKIAVFILSLFLFILAISLMKEGAYQLGPLVRDRFTVTNPVNSLGFGWICAYMIMSGSPVAASALTFLDAGIIDQLGAYAMITGSRLGASLLVLLIGLIYVLRGRSKMTSLDMGLLSLTVTGSTYLVALFMGICMLHFEVLVKIQITTGTMLISLFDRVFGPVLRIFLVVAPSWALFLVGLGLIMISFNLFDRCLPQMTLKESQLGQMSRMIYQPWVMFLLGMIITLISMSVSVSLAILVPLSQRHFVRRENVIPYIMGANISTFIDTLFAALLLDTPTAFTVVLTSVVSVTIVSLVILLTCYRRYEKLMLNATNWIMTSNNHLIIFVVIILFIPFLLLLL
jgi:Na+/phosphate symporter